MRIKSSSNLTTEIVTIRKKSDGYSLRKVTSYSDIPRRSKNFRSWFVAETLKNFRESMSKAIQATEFDKYDRNLHSDKSFGNF